MKQTHHIGYVQTPSVKNLSNVKNALVENGLVPLTTPNEMLPDAIEKGLVEFEKQILEKNKDYGAIYNNKYRIRYFDIDGKILKIEYVENGGKLTPPTKTPNYDPDYLIFDEWNYDIENYVVEQPTDVGAIYKTVDDATYMFCKFTTQTGLNPTLAISGFVSIDWGDGIVDTNSSHTYENEGNYLIKINGDITFATGGSSYLLGSSTNNSSLLKIYIKKGIKELTYTFQQCRALQIVSIPKGVTIINTNSFKYCVNLISLVFPKEVTRIGSYAVHYCYSLKNISLSSGIKSYDSQAFASCYSLTSVVLPKEVSELSGSSFEYNYSLKEIALPKNIVMLSSMLSECRSLKTVSIPKSVTTINSSAFYNCVSLTDCFIYCTNIPKLINTSAFSGTNPTLTFWVNDDIIEDLKVATGWSKYASQMKPLSWYPSLTDPNAE